ncbi:hypothetical protein, partial [Nocardia pseudobrasiliensis]|uniref:hypothetical protein n=1 Tax=Nocardia pseudobrasiliensis TaxID=45979 RepID=UPI001C3F54DA
MGIRRVVALADRQARIRLGPFAFIGLPLLRTHRRAGLLPQPFDEIAMLSSRPFRLFGQPLFEPVARLLVGRATRLLGPPLGLAG